VNGGDALRPTSLRRAFCISQGDQRNKSCSWLPNIMLLFFKRIFWGRIWNTSLLLSRSLNKVYFDITLFDSPGSLKIWFGISMRLPLV